MNRQITALACASLALAFILPATAQTVTVTVKEVHSSEGLILANLCGDPNGAFPGRCMTHSALAKAEQGTTTLSFSGVIPGRYAMQVFHDEDGNMIPTIPPEGYAFSNDAAWRPTFEEAAFTVSGDMSSAVTMKYLLTTSAPAQPALRGTDEADNLPKTVAVSGGARKE